MSKILDDNQLVTKVCKMFYVDNINQKEISEKLNLSRPTISRMIAKGKDLGIISVKISDRYDSKYTNLEENLKEVLRLKDVLVVEKKERIQDQIEAFSKTTAQFLSQIITDNVVVGLSYGPFFSNLSPYLLYSNVTDLTLVPLIGDIDTISLNEQANYNVMKLAEGFKVKPHYLFFPARVKDNMQRVIYKDYSDFFDLYDRLKIALYTIEAPKKIEIKKGTKYKDYLKEVNEGTVGEILLHGFNNDEFIFDEKNVIGFELENLSGLEYSIGIVNGEDKIFSTIVSLKYELVNVLIIDSDTATKLLEFYN